MLQEYCRKDTRNQNLDDDKRNEKKKGKSEYK